MKAKYGNWSIVSNLIATFQLVTFTCFYHSCKYGIKVSVSKNALEYNKIMLILFYIRPFKPKNSHWCCNKPLCGNYKRRTSHLKCKLSAIFYFFRNSSLETRTIELVSVEMWRLFVYNFSSNDWNNWNNKITL